MDLILHTDDGTTVLVVGNFESYLDPGTGGVMVARVGDLLRAIREAATAVAKPQLNPTQLELLSARMFQNADHVRALAERAPADDPDAPSVLELLRQLGLYTPPLLPPHSIRDPVVTGLTLVARTLTCDPGDYTGIPTISYQWQTATLANVTPQDITGQTAKTLSLAPAAAGRLFRCTVTATNPQGATTVASNVVGPVAAA